VKGFYFVLLTTEADTTLWQSTLELYTCQCFV